MAEEWMQMARREVPASLRAVVGGTGALEIGINTAKKVLTGSADEMRELRRQGNPVRPVDAFIQVRVPVALLEEARPSLDVLRMSHAAAGRAFRMYRARLGRGPAHGSGEPGWQDWHDNNLDVNRYATSAPGKVVDAASYAKAAADAIDMSTADQAWAVTYERLAERAVTEIDRAIHDLRALCRAAEAECELALKILYPEFG